MRLKVMLAVRRQDEPIWPGRSFALAPLRHGGDPLITVTPISWREYTQKFDRVLPQRQMRRALPQPDNKE